MRIDRSVLEKQQLLFDMATDDVEVTLSPADIPGAEISEPFDRHTVSDLRWWLLCRGIKVPTSWRKQKLIERYCSKVNDCPSVDSMVIYKHKLLACINFA